MKLKIGVMGAATGEHSKEALEKAAAVGKAIAEKDCVLLYGATIGFPRAAAMAARDAGATVIGVSPGANKEEHVENHKLPLECDVILFTGFGYQGRNVVRARSCDAVIIIGGRIGTMSEFAVAYAEQKPIGVLLGLGGFADKVKEIEEEVLQQEYPVKILYESSPEKLVERLLQLLQK